MTTTPLFQRIKLGPHSRDATSEALGQSFAIVGAEGLAHRTASTSAAGKAIGRAEQREQDQDARAARPPGIEPGDSLERPARGPVT